MKVWKKLAGVVLALAVMMSLSVSAMAASEAVLTGTNEATGADLDGTSFTVTLTKAGNTSGYRADTLVRYEIKDSSGNAITGSSPVSFGNPTNSGDYTIVQNSNNLAVERNFAAQQAAVTFGAVTFNLVFTKANFGATADGTASGNSYYKFQIEEVINSANSPDAVYDLYVFVKNDGSKTPFAAILADSSGDYDPALTTDANQGLKKAGFAPEFTPVQGGTVTIEKQIEGNNAKMSDTFQFEVKVDFTNAGVSGADNVFTYQATTTGSFGTSGGTNFDGTITYDEDSPTEFYVTLGDDKTVTIPNLPAGTVVSVREIEAEGDDYQVKSAADTTKTFSNSPTVITDFTNADSSTTYNTHVTVSAGDDGKIIFTNKRDVISPTGVVLRFAPYFAMLGAGLTTMVIAPRKKEEE